MRTISTALKAHFGQEVTTIAALVRITRTDGVVLGFTAHDRDLVVDGQLYEAESAMRPTSIEGQSTAAPDNLSVDGVLTSDRLTEADLLAGRFDDARLDVYWTNWSDPSQGVLHAGRYFVGSVNWKENRFTADLVSIKDALQRSSSWYITARCRNSLGDSLCRVDVAALTVATTFVSGDAATFTVAHFNDPETGLSTLAGSDFAYGLVEIVGGDMDGIRREIKSAVDGVLTLWEPLPRVPQAGATLTLKPGCNKLAATCSGRFDNIYNYGGFPTVPGQDKVIQVPDVKY